MKKTPIVGIMALLLIGLATTSAFAFMGYGKNVEVKQALEEGDYNAWKNAVSDSRMADIVDEDEFGMLVEMQQERMQKRSQMEQNRQLIRDAIENNDFEAYQSVISSLEDVPKNHEKILTEEDFNILVQMHQAKQSGDFDTAKELTEELGFDNFGRGHQGFGKGMHECK